MKKSYLVTAAALLFAFLIWTACVLRLDVQAVGPNGSQVGLASINAAFHRFTGVNMAIYTITDWLGLVPIFCVLGFAGLGCAQLVKRSSLWKVDRDILALGMFYITVMAGYIFFECFTVNYRPVLIAGVLEASYPSSTTLLALSIMPTVAMQLSRRIPNRTAKTGLVILIGLFTAFMVFGRLFCGVHWLSDIIAGALLSSAMVMFYAALIAK